jgi:hypothetical protein
VREGAQYILKAAAAKTAPRAGTGCAFCSGMALETPSSTSHQGAAGYQLTWMDAKVGD